VVYRLLALLLMTRVTAMIVGDAGHLGDRELMYLAIDAQFRFRPGFEFFRMVVLDAPIETKDLLKARGYKRSAGELGRPKCWYRDVPDADKAAEVSWLRNNVLRPNDEPSGFADYSPRPVFRSVLEVGRTSN